MTFGSLFAGIGGFDLGFERAGLTCVWQVEVDRACQRVLERLWPDVGRFPDIREVGGGQLAAVDLVCGGFPCQDVSVAGRRAGLDGPRSSLFHEFVRIIAELAPPWVVIENVPGLLSSRAGRDMGTVLGRLAQLGYGFAYRVLDAQHFGVAQRRRRVLIVGRLGDRASAAQVLLELEGVRGDPAPGALAGQATATAARTRALGCGDELESVGRCLTAHHGRFSPDDTLVPTFRIATRAHSAREAERWEASDLASTLNPWNLLRDPPPHLVTCVTGQLTHPLRSEGADASEDGTGRGTPIVVRGCGRRSTADEAGQAPEVVVSAVRRLTPRECERLQGFPDDWTAGESDAQRYRQLGNAVCVPVAEWIGRRLMAVHRRGAIRDLDSEVA